MRCSISSVTSARVHTTNNDTDWTKTKQSHASLAHDAGLTNGRHAKRHATPPTVAAAVHRAQLRHVVGVQVEFESKNFETGFSLLHRLKGWVTKPGAFELWVNFIQLVQPPTMSARFMRALMVSPPRCSGAGCIFERQTLKPFFFI
jgi:hypothetical protein